MLRRTECSGVFQNGSFSPPPARSTRGFFSDIYCGNLVKLLEVNLTMFWGPLYDWITPEFLTFRVVHTEPSPICPLQFRFSYPGTGSGGGFCARVSALVSCGSLYLLVHLSTLGGSSLPCVLPCLMDPRIVVC